MFPVPENRHFYMQTFVWNPGHWQGFQDNAQQEKNIEHRLYRLKMAAQNVFWRKVKPKIWAKNWEITFSKVFPKNKQTKKG